MSMRVKALRYIKAAWILLICWGFLTACNFSSDAERATESEIKASTEAAKIEVFEASSLETETAETDLPLNCPVMLSAHHVEVGRFIKHPSLRFHIIKNKDYDSSLGDACEGDIKNLWPDLLRFEREIEAYAPYIRNIGGISLNIEHFPQTMKAVKDHVNNSAVKYKLDEELDQFDRSTALGKNQAEGKILLFLRDSVDIYWINEHGPIIEGLLSEYGLKLSSFSQEKPKLCYDRYKLCICYEWKVSDASFDFCEDVSPENRKKSPRSYNLEYFPFTPYGGLSFKRPDDDNEK